MTEFTKQSEECGNFSVDGTDAEAMGHPTTWIRATLTVVCVNSVDGTDAEAVVST